MQRVGDHMLFTGNGRVTGVFIFMFTAYFAYQFDITTDSNGADMLKEAAGVAGGAILLPTLGVSIVACGLPGLLVAGAGVLLADTVMKNIAAPKEQSAPGAAIDSASSEISEPDYGDTWQKLG